MLSLLLCALVLLGSASALLHAGRGGALRMLGGFGWKSAPKAPTVAKSIVIRVDNSKTIECAEPGNMRKILQANKVDIYPLLAKFNNCGGGGVCGTCGVRVLEGMQNLSPASKNEQKVRLENKLADDIRLTCCTKVNGPVSIKTKP